MPATTRPDPPAAAGAAPGAAAGLFDPKTRNRAAFRRALDRPPARIRYVIHFTPRSGSSWLTDALTRTGRLSQPGECFNPAFVPRIARAMHAGNLRQYIAMLVRHRNTGGVFGCQLTYYHLRHVFGDAATFLDHLGAGPAFWLLREDIVLQAVSLAKLKQTRVGHSAHAGAEARAAADAAFAYDGDEIRRFVRHVLAAEDGTEAVLAAGGALPLRLSYERLTPLGAAAAVNIVAHHVGVPPVTDIAPGDGHEKLGTDRNADFAARFRDEHADFVAELEAARAARLAALAPDPAGSLPEAYRAAFRPG